MSSFAIANSSLPGFAIRKTLVFSVAPLISGLIVIVVVMSAPFGAISDRIVYLWIPFLLDYGSGPYLLMVIYSLLKSRKEEKS